MNQCVTHTSLVCGRVMVPKSFSLGTHHVCMMSWMLPAIWHACSPGLGHSAALPALDCVRLCCASSVSKVAPDCNPATEMTAGLAG